MLTVAADQDYYKKDFPDINISAMEAEVVKQKILQLMRSGEYRDIAEILCYDLTSFNFNRLVASTCKKYGKTALVANFHFVSHPGYGGKSLTVLPPYDKRGLSLDIFGGGRGYLDTKAEFDLEKGDYFDIFAIFRLYIELLNNTEMLERLLRVRGNDDALSQQRDSLVIKGSVQIQVSNATVFQKPHAVLKILKFSAAGHLTYLVSV